MSTSLFSTTPAVTVLDNRGLPVRELQYYRHPDAPAVTAERITRHQYDERGFLTQSADPRLHDAGLANFTYLTDLAGNVLRSQGVDNGITVGLNDAAGRPFMMVSNIRTASDGNEDRSQAVTHTWQYEDATLPGRPVSVTEQAPGEAARITERFVYAGNTDAEKDLNLAGVCVSHYDTAGLVQTDGVALTGVPLSVTRRLLKGADSPDTVADWQGQDSSAWNDLLNAETHTTLATTDATGAGLTTTDAQGNLQRVAYDVAGLLAGSWLTVKGGTEQVIVKSLTHSAAGQKLREEHGNGVVTTYTYEPETQRLTGIRTERPAGHAAGAKVLQDLRYEYDPVGNVLSVRNDAEETRFWRNQKVVPENTYVYDSLYQLVSATGREMANIAQQGSSLPSATVPLPADSFAFTNYTRSYTCDEGGNLTQIRHSAPATGNSYTTNITVSDKSNRGVLSTLTENPSDVDALFTAGGQQKQLQPGQGLVWTARNELRKVTPVVRDGGADDGEYYRYDANSQRLLKVSVQKSASITQTQRVMYLPGLELRSTKAGDAETESLQVIIMGEAGRAQVRVLHWESGRPADITNNQTRYSYDNLIGSSGLELDGDGKVISMEEYYPYGGTAVWAARSQAEADYKTVRYSGKERDATGLYCYGYRYYQPWVGRWLSSDPAGMVDGLNLFSMVRNNPVVYADPNGLKGISDDDAKRVYYNHRSLVAVPEILNNVMSELDMSINSPNMRIAIVSISHILRELVGGAAGVTAAGLVPVPILGDYVVGTAAKEIAKIATGLPDLSFKPSVSASNAVEDQRLSFKYRLLKKAKEQISLEKVKEKLVDKPTNSGIDAAAMSAGGILSGGLPGSIPIYKTIKGTNSLIKFIKSDSTNWISKAKEELVKVDSIIDNIDEEMTGFFKAYGKVYSVISAKYIADAISEGVSDKRNPYSAPSSSKLRIDLEGQTFPSLRFSISYDSYIKAYNNAKTAVRQTIERLTGDVRNFGTAIKGRRETRV